MKMAFRWTAATVLAAVSLYACKENVETSGEKGPETTNGGSCDPGDVSSPEGCEAPIVIGSQAELEALFGTTWAEIWWSSPDVAPSIDLQASTDLVFDASLFAVPSNCSTETCAQSVIFASARGTPAEGITLTETTLQVPAGTRFRVLPLVHGDPCHPGGCPDQPTVRVYPPCTQPCGEDELRCGSDMVCRGALDHCRKCLDRAEEQCGCYTFCGPQPDGTACEAWHAVDFYYQGTCQLGSCDTPAG